MDVIRDPEKSGFGPQVGSYNGLQNHNLYLPPSPSNAGCMLCQMRLILKNARRLPVLAVPSDRRFYEGHGGLMSTAG
ncbi:hypothetical protein TNCV_2100371 [Trichonephila clavipes]|nr:hypothetical protein TNCV_2100371 [Trichonephila clavipes]